MKITITSSVLLVPKGIFILFCLLDTGESLECYKCNATLSVNKPGVCEDTGYLIKCSEPAVCLSATYVLEDPISKQKDYTTIKSCYIKTGGQECDIFLKNMKHAPLQNTDKCFTCDENGCNHKSSASFKSLSVILALIGCYVLCLF